MTDEVVKEDKNNQALDKKPQWLQVVDRSIPKCMTTLFNNVK